MNKKYIVRVVANQKENVPDDLVSFNEELEVALCNSLGISDHILL